MTVEELASCLVSLEIARTVANQFKCLAKEDNDNIDKIATLLATEIAVSDKGAI